MLSKISRRDAIRNTAAAGIAASLVSNKTALATTDEFSTEQLCPHKFLTAGSEFYDVSRGNPKPFSLMGQARVDAGLTPESWRLNVTVDPFTEEGVVREAAEAEKEFSREAGNAITYQQLKDLGKEHGIKFIKAMQCLNIPQPLGQGLWEGVPLSVVLRQCGGMKNVRRVYFRGFHNNDPQQIFQSSVSYTQAMETPPGELPVFLAYKLNNEPISPLRGGPVRMIVPWAHGFKSIKWLQEIFLTNDYRINDTYALNNNDPESYLKTSAYLDKGPSDFIEGEPILVTGQAINGYSGLSRVEYWVRELVQGAKRLDDNSPEIKSAPWQKCSLADQPVWSDVLPVGTDVRSVLGFNSKTGEPNSWPLRYGMISFYTVLRDLKAGRYEIRARTVDQNGFAQPEPRNIQKSGKNAIQTRRITILPREK